MAHLMMSRCWIARETAALYLPWVVLKALQLALALKVLQQALVPDMGVVACLVMRLGLVCPAYRIVCGNGLCRQLSVNGGGRVSP